MTLLYGSIMMALIGWLSYELSANPPSSVAESGLMKTCLVLASVTLLAVTMRALFCCWYEYINQKAQIDHDYLKRQNFVLGLSCVRWVVLSSVKDYQHGHRRKIGEI